MLLKLILQDGYLIINQRNPTKDSLEEDNNMGFFDKYCEKCGIKVDKKVAPQRFGKYFCSEEHAAEYVAEVEEMRKQMPEQTQQRRRGGCC